MGSGESVALRHAMRFKPRRIEALVQVDALRRPEVVLRRTRYTGLVVDERILTRAFPWVERRPSLQAIVLLGGRLRLGACAGLPPLELARGEVLLLLPADASRGRFEDVDYFDVEWTPGHQPAGVLPRKLGAVDVGRARALAERLTSGDGSDRALYAEAIALVRGVGAPIGFDAAAFEGGPSERDLRVARALSEQLADLREATAAPLGELAGLSPRQLQRVLQDFTERYRLNATNWRDMRNRYRLQIGVTLLCREELAVADVADEVGYASAAAFARALANAGLPAPTQLRGEVARMGSVP
jgi:AraC-like DNA-binding protein